MEETHVGWTTAVLTATGLSREFSRMNPEKKGPKWGALFTEDEHCVQTPHRTPEIGERVPNILRSRPDQKASVVSTEQRRGTLRLVPSGPTATQLLHLVRRQAQLNRAPCKICIVVLDYTMYILLCSGRLG